MFAEYLQAQGDAPIVSVVHGSKPNYDEFVDDSPQEQSDQNDIDFDDSQSERSGSDSDANANVKANANVNANANANGNRKLDDSLEDFEDGIVII